MSSLRNMSATRRRRIKPALHTLAGSLITCNLSRQHSINRLFSASSSDSLKLYNSLTGKLEVLPKGDRIACYTCGPTVYAPAHLGHARNYVFMDIFRRVWESTGARPVFVLNITDVDDKILTAAAQNNESPTDLARRYENAFWQDLDALNCLRPTFVTRVTEHVESSIVPYIQRLVDQKMAYVIQGEGVYFDVRAFDDSMQRLNSRYGKLAPPAQAKDFILENQPTAGTQMAFKKDSRDFALWKFRKADESLFWVAPWGEGRPGWHIECSAMIESVSSALNVPFSVHAGGIDLQFPHHTNEIAQAEAYHMRGHWIDHWLHTGHLHIDGLKMSKSLKNFITIEDMLSDETDSILSSPSDDFRLWCLSGSSYRSPVIYSKDRIAQAKQIRQGLVRFLIDAERWLQKSVSETKKWSTNDVKLFHFTYTKYTEGRETLLNDLGGAVYVQCMSEIAQAGFHYLSNNNPHITPHEPLTNAIRLLREMISLVGFSDSTAKAGQCSGSGEISHVVGGESALLDELVKFRATIRSIAINSMRDEAKVKDNLNAILRTCDDLRDCSLPSMGVELVDGAVRGSKSDNDDSMHFSWQFRVPTSECPPKPDSPTSQRPLSLNELKAIPLQDYFKVGQYKDVFSEFDETGLPTKYTDGADVSSRLRKKLLKKLEKHASRLDSTKSE